MPVIVFSKRTGKYLRRHSGSFKRAVRKTQYKIVEMLQASSLPIDRKKFDEMVRRFSKDRLFNANPEDARVYTTKGSALTSVGISSWADWDKSDKRVYKLPDYLEIHEIKESFVCVMRPDGSSNCDDEDAK